MERAKVGVLLFSQRREGAERMARSNDAHAVVDGPRARRGYGTIEVRPRRDEGSPEFDERVRKALKEFDSSGVAKLCGIVLGSKPATAKNEARGAAYNAWASCL